jgi:hypothetical protein
MNAIISIILSLTTLFPAAPPEINAPPSWTECAADDAECDAATEDDGDLCSVADCYEDD